MGRVVALLGGVFLMLLMVTAWAVWEMRDWAGSEESAPPSSSQDEWTAAGEQMVDGTATSEEASGETDEERSVESSIQFKTTEDERALVGDNDGDPASTKSSASIHEADAATVSGNAKAETDPVEGGEPNTGDAKGPIESNANPNIWTESTSDSVPSSSGEAESNANAAVSGSLWGETDSENAEPSSTQTAETPLTTSNTGTSENTEVHLGYGKVLSQSSPYYVELQRNGQTYPLGTVPAGRYAIWAYVNGREEPPQRAGTVQVQVDKTSRLTCKGSVCFAL